MAEHRRRFWIDRFQTILCIRIAVYFLVYQILVWSLLAVWRGLHEMMEKLLGSEAATAGLLLGAVSVVLLGLAFVYDAAKLTHRIVGPIYRVRKTVQAVIAGDEVEKMNLRRDDYLQELKDEINEMLKVLEQRGAIVMKTDEAEQSSNQPVSV